MDPKRFLAPLDGEREVIRQPAGHTTAAEVVVTLRRADTITMQLAAGVGPLREATERAGTGAHTAADADVAQDVLHRLMDAIAGPGNRTRPSGPRCGGPVGPPMKQA